MKVRRVFPLPIALVASAIVYSAVSVLGAGVDASAQRIESTTTSSTAPAQTAPAQTPPAHQASGKPALRPAPIGEQMEAKSGSEAKSDRNEAHYSKEDRRQELSKKLELRRQELREERKKEGAKPKSDSDSD